MTVSIPFTPIRDGYTVVPSYPIIEARLEGGATRKRLEPLYRTHELQVNWKLVSAVEYTNFMGFFRTTLQEGTEYFLMDLVTDIGATTPHRCRLKGGLPKLQQVNGNCFYCTSVIEADVNPTYTGLILYRGPDVIEFSHNHPVFVGPLEVGDSIQIFNSEGEHPEGTTEWSFDGVNDRAVIGDVLDFERTSPFSVSGWFNSTGSATVTNGGRIISKADTTANQRGWLIAAAGVSGGAHVQFGLINTVVTNNIRVETTGTYSNGVLNHFVATYDGSVTGAGVKIYLNGILQTVSIVNNNLSATTLSSAVLTLGNREDSARSFQGLIKHLAVWNSELTAGDVTEIYNSGTPPNLLSVSAASDLVGWWKLDGTDVVGTNGINDRSTNNNHATAEQGLAPTGSVGPTELNLDGTYQIAAVDANDEIQLVNPGAVNTDWLTLAGIGSYGTEDLGNVISTITRIPS